MSEEKEDWGEVEIPNEEQKEVEFEIGTGGSSLSMEIPRVRI